MQDIHGIRPPVPVGFDPQVFKTLLVVAGGVFLLVLLFFLIRKWLKNRNSPHDLKYLPEPLAPYDAALKELDTLFQKQMLDPRLFYFDLTAVLRNYIGRSFGINAIEMTSQEFIRAINLLAVDKQVKKEIASFQSVSDPFKYAGIMPDKQQVKADLLFIKEMIDRIEKDRVREQQGENS